MEMGKWREKRNGKLVIRRRYNGIYCAKLDIPRQYSSIFVLEKRGDLFIRHPRP
jgi:hypothetical protein